MAQSKAHEVDRWLKRPDRAIFVVLIYGPDRGLVSERAAAFASATGVPLDDPFSVVRFDAAEMDGDAGRLLDEANTVPLFGGRRLIWIRNAGSQKALSEALKVLLDSPPPEVEILIEAGDLKKGVAIRTVVEQAPRAMALPCYADEGRGLDQLIDTILAEAGLTISPDARQLLRASLGADRRASRSEIEKLTLYCHGRNAVETADVAASIGDVAATSVDDIVDLVLAGRIDDAEDRMRRHFTAGAAPFLLLSAMMRQFQAMLAMRADMDARGRDAASAVAAARPPIFFSRRGAVEAALRTWNSDAISGALDRLQSAVLATRRRPELAAELVRQTVYALAATPRRRAA